MKEMFSKFLIDFRKWRLIHTQRHTFPYSQVQCCIVYILGMDQLQQILIHKLRLISDYRNRGDLHDHCDKYSLQLLKEKRKQSSTQIIESRLLQALVNNRVDAPYRIEEFYRQSRTLINIYDHEFVYTHQNQEDTYANIVALYAQFFEQNKCSRRAEELKNIFHKKLCEKSMLIPTVLNWFAEWTRKTFSSFIKNTLFELNQSARFKKKSELAKKQAKVQKSLEFEKEKLQYNNSLALEGVYSKVSELLKSPARNLCPIVQRIKPRKIEIATKLTNQNEEQRSLQQRNRGLSKQVRSRYNMSSSLAHIQSSPKDIQSSSLAHIQSSTKDNQSSSLAHILPRLQPKVSVTAPIPSLPGINKQVLYSSFSEQIMSYYRFHAKLLPDLDLAYLRSHRRVDKREKITAQLQLVVNSIARGQADIKKSIEAYQLEYLQKFKKSDHSSMDNGSWQVELSGSCQLMPQFIKSHQKRKEDSQRARAQQKAMEIQLPQLAAGTAKTLLLLNSPPRYQEKLDSMPKEMRGPKGRISAQLTRNLEHIKSILNIPGSSSGKSLDLRKQLPRTNCPQNEQESPKQSRVGLLPKIRN